MESTYNNITINEFIGENFFTKAINRYDLCIYLGHGGMFFNLHQKKFLNFDLNGLPISYPFRTIPNAMIEYSKGKYLLCIPMHHGDYFKLENILKPWLKKTKHMGIKSVAYSFEPVQ